MTAILRLQSRGFLRSSLVLAGLFVLLGGFLFAAFPGFADQAELVEEAFPPVLVAFLGIEAIHTIEGFVASYTISLVWILFAGLYVAYAAAGTIAAEIESRRMDLTLSNPVSRESVVIQKAAALWLPLVVLTVALFAVLSVGAWTVGESLDPVALAATLLLGIPYLLVCGGIGLVLSVVVDRTETAQAAATGAVFMLWLVDGLSQLDPDYEWIGEFTPSRYLDPAAILVREEYALGDAVVLLAAFVVLVAVATAVFVRRDI